MNTICIYIEKYLFNEKLFPYIRNFLFELNKKFYLYIYIPDICIIKNIKKNKDIYNYLKYYNLKLHKDHPYFKFNILLIFSDYDRGMYFDRREIIVKSINYNYLFMINTDKFKNVIAIKNIKCIKLLNETGFMCKNEKVIQNIFYTYKLNNLDNFNKFKNKYSISSNNKLLGLLFSTKLNKFMKKYLYKISKSYIIITINSNIKEKGIININYEDFIYLMSYSSKFITDNKNLEFVYFTTNKPIKLINSKYFYSFTDFINSNMSTEKIIDHINKFYNLQNDIKNKNYIKINDNKKFKWGNIKN